MAGLPLLANLCPHQQHGVIDRPGVFSVAGFQVIVRPVTDNQPRQLIDPPRLGVLDP